MKKKIVIKVSMQCEKCRSKALKIAAGASDVSSVALEGNDRDEVVVTGDEVDAIYLTTVLRKKFRHATIVSMVDVKDKKEEKKEEKEEEKKEEKEEKEEEKKEEKEEEKNEEKETKEKKSKELLYCYSDQFPHCAMYYVYDDLYASNCTIM